MVADISQVYRNCICMFFLPFILWPEPALDWLRVHEHAQMLLCYSSKSGHGQWAKVNCPRVEIAAIHVVLAATEL